MKKAVFRIFPRVVILPILSLFLLHCTSTRVINFYAGPEHDKEEIAILKFSGEGWFTIYDKNTLQCLNDDFVEAKWYSTSLKTNDNERLIVKIEPGNYLIKICHAFAHHYPRRSKDDNCRELYWDAEAGRSYTLKSKVEWSTFKPWGGEWQRAGPWIVSLEDD